MFTGELELTIVCATEQSAQRTAAKQNSTGLDHENIIQTIQNNTKLKHTSKFTLVLINKDQN